MDIKEFAKTVIALSRIVVSLQSAEPAALLGHPSTPALVRDVKGLATELGEWAEDMEKRLSR